MDRVRGLLHRRPATARGRVPGRTRRRNSRLGARASPLDNEKVGHAGKYLGHSRRLRVGTGQINEVLAIAAWAGKVGLSRRFRWCDDDPLPAQQKPLRGCVMARDHDSPVDSVGEEQVLCVAWPRSALHHHRRTAARRPERRMRVDAAGSTGTRIARAVSASTAASCNKQMQWKSVALTWSRRRTAGAAEQFELCGDFAAIRQDARHFRRPARMPSRTVSLRSLPLPRRRAARSPRGQGHCAPSNHRSQMEAEAPLRIGSVPPYSRRRRGAPRP